MTEKAEQISLVINIDARGPGPDIAKLRAALEETTSAIERHLTRRNTLGWPPPVPPPNAYDVGDQTDEEELQAYLWRDRRARVNDELHEADARGTSESDVPRATHLDDGKQPSRDGFWAMMAFLIGLSLAIVLMLYWLSCGGTLGSGCRP